MNATTFTIRTPVDLIALAPLVLGFRPSESVIVETFGGACGAFHARCDLVEDEGDQDTAATMLLEAALSNHVRQAAILVFSKHPDRARRQATVCEDLFGAAGIEIVDTLHVGSQRFWRLPVDDLDGTPYDVADHPFTIQWMFDGRAVHPSREAMEATLDPADPHQRARVETEFVELVRGRLAHGQTPAHARADAIWMQGRIRRWIRKQRELTPVEAARMLWLCTVPQLREVAWAQMSRECAGRHVELWRRLVVLAPDALVPDAALTLAFASWLHGDGAFAWCALDKFANAGGDPEEGQIVGGLLENAVSPSTWVPMDPSRLSVFAVPEAG